MFDRVLNTPLKQYNLQSLHSIGSDFGFWLHKRKAGSNISKTLQCFRISQYTVKGPSILTIFYWSHLQIFINCILCRVISSTNTEAVVSKCSLNKLFLKFSKFHRKATVLESLFDKVGRLKACNFIKIRLQHKSFPMKFAKFLKTSFFTSGDCFCK